MANAYDCSITSFMHCIVAANCFLRSETCIFMIFYAWTCTISTYSLASLTMSFFMIAISFLISSILLMTAFSNIFSKSSLLDPLVGAFSSASIVLARVVFTSRIQA